MAATNSEPVEAAPRGLEQVTTAVVGRERASRQATIQKLQKIWDKQGEQALFEREAEENLKEDKQPNFQEIHSVLDNISDPRRKAALKSKANLLQEMVEGADPGTVEPGATPDAHVQQVARVASTMPGLVAALARETGGSIATVKRALEQPNFSRSSPLGKLVERFLKDEKFTAILRKNIAENLDKPEDLISLDEIITSTDAKVVSDQKSVDSERNSYTNAAHTGSFDRIDDLKRNNPTVYNSLMVNIAQYDTAIKSLATNQTLKSLAVDTTIGSQLDAASLQDAIESQIVTLSNGNLTKHTDVVPPPPKTTTAKDPYMDTRSQLMELKRAWDVAEKARASYNIPGFQNSMIDILRYNEYVSANGKKTELDGRQETINTTKVELAKNKSKRDKLVNNQAQKVDRLMNKSVKDYYNNIVLSQADAVAQAEAQQKAVDTKEAKDMAAKRELLCKQILDKYLMLTYLKYKGKDVVGWDDKALKDFVKHDMVSNSPGNLGKKLLERINTKRTTMQPAFSKEIQKLMTEMGVGTGQPPLTARDVINSIGTEQYEKWAAEKVPDVLGYAWSRGYYFDRLKLKPAEAEFMKRAYPEDTDFFNTALAAKEKYVGEAQTLMDEDLGIMDGGVINREKVKKFLFGKDWTEGGAKLMKTLAVAGAGYVLGGGLAFNQAANAFVGPTHFVENVVNVGKAVGNTVGAVSRAGDMAVAAGSQAVRDVVNMVPVRTP